MDRRWLSAASMPVALAGALLLTGCTSNPGATGDHGAAAPSVVEATRRSALPLPPQPTAVPQTSSGPLAPEFLPTPDDLGPGWQSRVEGADEEDGVGNGTAYQARDPDEIVETTLPMGCEVRSPSPVAQDVLQSTYQHTDTGAYAVALRMRFSSAAAAQEFAVVRGRDLQSCRDQPEDPYSGAPAPVLTVSSGPAWQNASYRLVGEQAVWVSALQIQDRDILTLDTDADPATLVDWDGLAFQEP